MGLAFFFFFFSFSFRLSVSQCGQLRVTSSRLGWVEVPFSSEL